MPEHFRTLHHATKFCRDVRDLTTTETHRLVDNGEIAIGSPPGKVEGVDFHWDANGRATAITRPEEPAVARVPASKRKAHRE